MKVVIDTNVYVSGLLFGGVPKAILKAAFDGRMELAASPAILVELSETLRDRFQWPDSRLAAALDAIRLVAMVVEPAMRIEECADPDDDRVLECAVESGAAVIITGDKHLLDMHPFRGIEILRPREAAARLGLETTI